MNYYSPYSLVGSSQPLALAGWLAVSLMAIQGRVNRRSKVKKFFLQNGLSSDVYELVMDMRGGNSRLALLQHMETPRHRMELSGLTGIDWKEVDRELGVLEKFGLVRLQAQSGSVKLYQNTEQGKILARLIAELSPRGSNSNRDSIQNTGI